jgi:manganese/zinc/iron transport system permease protein
MVCTFLPAGAEGNYMSTLTLELIAIAVLASVACVIPGVFLVLRGVSLMSDAMSHALLLGIVATFLLVRSLTSPWLLVGAALAGFAVVVVTEYAMQQFRLHKDAAIGLFFPFFFSIAVVLISLFTRDVHLDTDMVLLGDMVFAPFSRCVIAGIDCGPQAIVVILSMLCISVGVLALLYRPLVMSIFDPLCARTAGVSATTLYYGMIFLTSMVAVAVFSVVGSVIVVALMIVPAATAYCTARSVPQMIAHAMMVSVIAAVSGYSFAAWADLSIAGAIAVMTGIIFVFVALMAPRIGIIGMIFYYGSAWLLQSLALIEKQYAHKVINMKMLQQKYGWSLLWAWCVLWYGLYTKRLVRIAKKSYVIS